MQSKIQVYELIENTEKRVFMKALSSAALLTPTIETSENLRLNSSSLDLLLGCFSGSEYEGSDAATEGVFIVLKNTLTSIGEHLKNTELLMESTRQDAKILELFKSAHTLRQSIEQANESDKETLQEKLKEIETQLNASACQPINN